MLRRLPWVLMMMNQPLCNAWCLGKARDRRQAAPGGTPRGRCLSSLWRQRLVQAGEGSWPPFRPGPLPLRLRKGHSRCDPALPGMHAAAAPNMLPCPLRVPRPLPARAGRTIAMWAAFWAMAAFFMIPVTAVQGLLTMNSFLGWVGGGRGWGRLRC